METCHEASGHSRIIATIQVSPELFDWFFNSERGYRGAYYASIHECDMCNRQLIDVLATPLLAYAIGRGLDADAATRSLKGSSSKAWLAELRERSLCPNCEGEWSAPRERSADILNGRWDLSDSPLARFGRSAPALSQVRVMGAFVKQHSVDYVPQHKRTRPNDIHGFGWS